jgi:hypothetical protein
VSDGILQSEATFDWTVTNVNRPPVLTPPGEQNGAERQDASLQLQAEDADGDVLTYGAQGLPPGLSIDTQTGLIDGKAEAGSAGVYAVEVSVSDGADSDTRTFEWTIAASPFGPDVNRDGHVDALDIQLVVNSVLGIDIAPYDADVNGDGPRDAIDVQMVVNAVLGVPKSRRLPFPS